MSTQTAATKPTTHIDWSAVIEERQILLAKMAYASDVSFTDEGADRLVAITIREDISAATRQVETLVGRGTITAVGLIELPYPSGRRLLLRRGDEAWMAPDEPNGWDRREPWLGDLNSVRWVDGPPAIAAFVRVGAPT